MNEDQWLAREADIRAELAAEYVPALMEHLRILVDLRAQVQALRDEAFLGQRDDFRAYDNVLALFDGI